MIGAIIYSALANNAGVAALVGQRIYPEEAPDEADLPLIVYGVQANEQIDGSARLIRSTVTVNTYAATDTAAEAVAAAIRTALEDYNGTDSGATLRALHLDQYAELRDQEVALWGRLMTFVGWIIR